MIRPLLLLATILCVSEAMSPNKGVPDAVQPHVDESPDQYCQSLCGPSNLCRDKGSYCKAYGPPGDGVGVCQGFYYRPDNSLCYFGFSDDCPENRPVFCRGNGTTTPGPTTTTSPVSTTTAGPSTTTAPGNTTTAGPSTTTAPGNTTTPGPSTTTPAPSAAHPTGLYVGSGNFSGTAFSVNATFSENDTILEKM
ncbi:conserved hypothetical protein [Perkinsus marinus ATCC 50983]|nr:conserved hypothetical protein [Perkinsus marinus ATCC 50983]EER11026.1 conserved hypothetical protein [Perkinsus marinus ATCC 50983]|eukprot:XP_002779231.1 conserved hypothetical protein [Perkinsus marinus ATCC 50983]